MMKIKYYHSAIAAFFALIFNVVGVLFKILHWQFELGPVVINGSILTTIGIFFGALAGMLFLIRVLVGRNKTLLNR